MKNVIQDTSQRLLIIQGLLTEQSFSITIKVLFFFLLFTYMYFVFYFVVFRSRFRGGSNIFYYWQYFTVFSFVLLFIHYMYSFNRWQPSSQTRQAKAIWWYLSHTFGWRWELKQDITNKRTEKQSSAYPCLTCFILFSFHTSSCADALYLSISQIK